RTRETTSQDGTKRKCVSRVRGNRRDAGKQQSGKATKLPLPATALMPPPRPPAKDKKMALCRFKQSLYHDLRFALQMACGAKRLLNLVLGPGAHLAWYSKCEFIPCEIEAGQRGQTSRGGIAGIKNTPITERVKTQ